MGQVEYPSSIPSTPAYVNSAKLSRGKTLTPSADEAGLDAVFCLAFIADSAKSLRINWINVNT